MAAPMQRSLEQTGRRALSGPPSIFSGLEIREDGSPGAGLLALAIVMIFLASIAPGSAALLTPIACAFILLVGMPHGMFDYLTLRKLGRGSPMRVIGVTAVYLGAAAAVWLLWQSASHLALAVFIGIAMLHFSEDWIEGKSRLGAAAMAVSMIALPALTYPAELSAIFVLIGGVEAGIMSDFLRLVAPVFGLVALANIAMDWGGEERDQARRNMCLLIAAAVLPPGIGFAVYFCLYHSPIHFVEGRKTLMDHQSTPRHFFLCMSLASAGVVLWIMVAQPFEAMDARLIAATFQTLSILTVPHMLLPFFAAKSAADSAADSAA